MLCTKAELHLDTGNSRGVATAEKVLAVVARMADDSPEPQQRAWVGVLEARARMFRRDWDGALNMLKTARGGLVAAQQLCDCLTEMARCYLETARNEQARHAARDALDALPRGSGRVPALAILAVLGEAVDCPGACATDASDPAHPEK